MFGNITKKQDLSKLFLTCQWSRDHGWFRLSWYGPLQVALPLKSRHKNWSKDLIMEVRKEASLVSPKVRSTEDHTTWVEDVQSVIKCWCFRRVFLRGLVDFQTRERVEPIGGISQSRYYGTIGCDFWLLPGNHETETFVNNLWTAQGQSFNAKADARSLWWDQGISQVWYEKVFTGEKFLPFLLSVDRQMNILGRGS